MVVVCVCGGCVQDFGASPRTPLADRPSPGPPKISLFFFSLPPEFQGARILILAWENMCSAFGGPLGHSAFMLRFVKCSFDSARRARGRIANIGEVLRTCLPSETCVTSSGRAVINAPFRECVVFPLRSKRFCAEDRGFLSEAGQFPFGKPLVWRRLGPRLWFYVLVSSVCRLCLCFCWLFCCSRFSFFLSVFRVCPIFFIGTCLFRFRAWFMYILRGGRPWDAFLWPGKGMSSTTLPYKRRAPTWVKLRA